MTGWRVGSIVDWGLSGSERCSELATGVGRGFLAWVFALREDFKEPVEIRVGLTLQAEPRPRILGGVCSHSSQEILIGQKTDDGIPHGFGVPAADQNTGGRFVGVARSFVAATHGRRGEGLDLIWYPTNTGRDDRRATGQRFGDGQAPSLTAGGMDIEVRRLIVAGNGSRIILEWHKYIGH